MGPTIKTIKLKDLIPDPKNARVHSGENLDAISDSLLRFGAGRSIVIDGDGIVRAGNGTLEAAREAGIENVTVIESDGKSLIAVKRSDWSPLEAAGYGIADNRAAELGAWDPDRLRETIAELQALDPQVDIVGFSEADLSELLKTEPEAELEPDEEPLIEPPKVAVTKPGDVWELGDHRLLCGDSTDREAIRLLMRGELADLVFTDPPYNVAEGLYGTRSKAKSKAVLAKSDWDKGFNFSECEENILEVLNRDCSVYVCSSQHTASSIWDWMSAWADFYSFCVWHKPNPMPSLSKRHWTWDCELICYATRGKHTFNFSVEGHCPSFWDFTKVPKCDLHPTMKPISVPTHAILHSSNQDQLVGDFFAGSGTTLIACEQTGRKCRAMEISPEYCDVIVRRWESSTKREARLIRDGKYVSIA